MRETSKILIVYGLTLAGTLLWLAAIFLAPLLRDGSNAGSSLLYACFSLVCHQKAERCFSLHGYPLAVCARCLGIYLGFLGGMVAYPLRRGFSELRLPGKSVFLAMSVPIVLDAAANIVGLWNTPNVLRLATGLIWGAILPFYVLTGLGELVLKRKKE